LKAVDRKKTPWLIVSGHRPFYSSGNSPTDLIFAQHLREHLEDLFYRYKVDLVLTGHYHNYERTCPVYKEKCTPGAPTHVLVGTAGIELERDFMDPKPAWSIERTAIFGHAEIKSFDEKSLRFRLIACEDGLVRDEFWLKK